MDLQDFDLQSLEGEIVCEKPTSNLENWDGYIKIKQPNKGNTDENIICK